MKKQKGKAVKIKSEEEMPAGDIMIPVNAFWRKKINDDYGEGTADFLNWVGGSYHHTFGGPIPVSLLHLFEMRKFFQEIGDEMGGQETVRGLKIASMLMDVKFGVDFGFGSSNQGVGTC